MKIDLQVVTPEKIAFKGEINQISLPTKNGQITILPNHISLVSTIEGGELIIKNDKEETLLAVYGGFVEVRKNQVRVMTDVAQRVDEIDEEKAQKARDEAQKRLTQKDQMSDVDFADALRQLEKSLALLKVAGSIKRRGIK
ncbi:MAG: ATP synthase F1 subunit epsilon [Candidatus Pacebacteria bacterium]|nr:ATP synthase F1 subunit epsilon [Candidatus Paceibacterota bacterium]